MYHLYTESGMQVDTSSFGDKNPDQSVLELPSEKQKKIEEKINTPVPPQCFRHVYRDERG
jgi:hypothetical protein